MNWLYPARKTKHTLELILSTYKDIEWFIKHSFNLYSHIELIQMYVWSFEPFRINSNIFFELYSFLHQISHWFMWHFRFQFYHFGIQFFSLWHFVHMHANILSIWFAWFCFYSFLLPRFSHMIRNIFSEFYIQCFIMFKHSNTCHKIMQTTRHWHVAKMNILKKLKTEYQIWG